MPNKANWKALIRNLEFVVDTRMKALTYEYSFKEDDREVLILKAHCDSVYGGKKDTISSLSATGYCIYLNDCLIAWKSRAQKTLSLSSTEEEYIVVSEEIT